VNGGSLRILDGTVSVRDLALDAIEAGRTLAQESERRAGGGVIAYESVLSEGGLLPPVDHPDPAHCIVTGTGLTHLGSADARDKMHQQANTAAQEPLTDSMKMFRWGLEGGKPASGFGVQPEWFYKGDGSCVAAPETPLTMPDFSLDGGEEPEIAGLYVVAPDGTPYRIGFAIGNEFSDHVTERQNYLYLAHSKLRACSFGPEVLLGDLPEDVQGVSRITRSGGTLWEKPFVSGEANMSHWIRNLEHHHFKYAMFRRPGDVHVHFFGTATLSFTDGVKVEPGDVFEMEVSEFGRPLRNALAIAPAPSGSVRSL
jgi:hypothetical protein